MTVSMASFNKFYLKFPLKEKLSKIKIVERYSPDGIIKMLFSKLFKICLTITKSVSMALRKVELTLRRAKVVTLREMEDRHSHYTFQPFTVSKVVTSLPKPIARSGHRIVCDEKYLYLFGGYNPKIVSGEGGNNSSLFKELWRMNLASKEWELLNVKNLPPCLASNSLLLIGDILFVYGGSGVPFGANSSNKLQTCDLSREELEFITVETTGINPMPGYGQACFVKENKFYVIGGTTGYTYWCDVDVLDMKTNRWEAVYTCLGTQNEPEGRYRHELGTLDDRVYILGGGVSEKSFGFNIINAYFPKENTWTSVRTHGDQNSRYKFPQPRRFHSSVQLGRKVYIVGGMRHRKALKDAWSLDLETLKWTYEPSLNLPNATFFHDSCLTQSGKLYTFGGVAIHQLYAERTSDLFSSWICIPSLKELAWEALLFYGLHKCQQILPLIPSPFRQRLSNNS